MRADLNVSYDSLITETEFMKSQFYRPKGESMINDE